MLERLKQIANTWKKLSIARICASFGYFGLSQYFCSIHNCFPVITYYGEKTLFVIQTTNYAVFGKISATLIKGRVFLFPFRGGVNVADVTRNLLGGWTWDSRNWQKLMHMRWIIKIKVTRAREWEMTKWTRFLAPQFDSDSEFSKVNRMQSVENVSLKYLSIGTKKNPLTKILKKKEIFFLFFL